MRFELYPGSLNDINRAQETVFGNRHYIKPKDDFFANVSEPTELQGLEQAAESFVSWMADYPNKVVNIVVDCDVDGYASASMLYCFIRKFYPDVEVHCHLHSAKQHGLTDDIPWRDFECSYVILPDAGTNDKEQCGELIEKGNVVLILDHHIKEVENYHSNVINSRDGSYRNPNLCGTGVVWQFIRYICESEFEGYHMDVLDMVAVATASDDMDVTVPENYALLRRGLSVISHPLFDAIAYKAGVSTMGMTCMDVQFSIAPYINAMIRVGSSDEKELLFKAFCREYEEFDYKKRGSTETVVENIYERTARLCYNAKNRQKNKRDEGIEALVEQIEKKNLDANKIIVVNATGIPASLTGLVANQIADKYSKPCLVLRKMTDAENGEEGMYTGSGRNPDKSAVAELKPLLESTGLFEFVSGHVNAFGVKIHRSNIARMVETVNGLIGNNESVVYVDFILSDIDFDTAAILHKEVRPYCGTGFAEPLVAIDELILRRNNMVVMGKYSNSWKYEDDNMCFVKFGVPDGDPVMEWINEESAGNTISITAFGNVGINQWLGKVSGQMIIREYDVLSKE